MTGFPNRISRDALGPTLADNYPVENPETDIPASAFNTLFHQVAGMNSAHSVRAVVVSEDDGTVIYQGEAWNPNNDQAHPVVAQTGTGTYTVTFASTYLDETGAAVATQLLFARAQFLGEVSSWSDLRTACAWVDTSSPLVVNVTTWNPATGTAADAKFLLEVA